MTKKAIRECKNRIKSALPRLACDRRGTTMAELIVSFMLLAIFLLATTMVITNSIKTYYHEQELMSIYSVADTVLSESREEIRRMQSSDLGGYVKLRTKGSGVPDPVVPADALGMEGQILEFIRSNEKDGYILVQMDDRGCSDDTMMIDAEGVLKDADELKGTIPADQLTTRYYLKHRADKSNATYGSLCMDRLPSGSSANTVTGYQRPDLTDSTPLIWDAENKLPTTTYLGYPIRLSFSMKPYADAGKWKVSYVDVTVEVLKGLPTPEVPTPEILYTKTGTVTLQNEVIYNEDPTLYSDV